jgi:hypothetical protein
VQAPYTPPEPAGELGGVHDTRRRSFSCRRKRFEIKLEVTTLDVAVPFMVVLDGDVTILPLRWRMS